MKEEKDLAQQIIEQDHEIRAHSPFTSIIACPLCLEKHVTTIATMKLIATRRHIDHEEIVNLSMLISCPLCGMMNRIGCFSDHYFTAFQGGILETTIMKRE